MATAARRRATSACAHSSGNMQKMSHLMHAPNTVGPLDLPAGSHHNRSRGAQHTRRAADAALDTAWCMTRTWLRSRARCAAARCGLAQQPRQHVSPCCTAFLTVLPALYRTEANYSHHAAPPRSVAHYIRHTVATRGQCRHGSGYSALTSSPPRAAAAATLSFWYRFFRFLRPSDVRGASSCSASSRLTAFGNAGAESSLA